MLAYAMTLALLESFTTLIQTLSLRELLSSSEVQAGVQAEWSRRKTERESANGMFAKSKFRSKSTFNNPKKPFDRLPPADHSKYCSIHQKTGHSTENCFKNKGKTSKSANVALTESKSLKESQDTSKATALSLIFLTLALF
ncbi:hypothetical protein M231_06706 [Tremella mesenterica]|uniref:Uncharacterized protein n=1 Tax=Tremella mesenterica TaxID=5217 RepID=A0A4Q1BB73_TREME|nr:hypothetical protein M231_06706 [Tremella mesenterica]